MLLCWPDKFYTGVQSGSSSKNGSKVVVSFCSSVAQLKYLVNACTEGPNKLCTVDATTKIYYCNIVSLVDIAYGKSIIEWKTYEKFYYEIVGCNFFEFAIVDFKMSSVYVYINFLYLLRKIVYCQEISIKNEWTMVNLGIHEVCRLFLTLQFSDNKVHGKPLRI